jgi:hypothetical protein
MHGEIGIYPKIAAKVFSLLPWFTYFTQADEEFFTLLFRVVDAASFFIQMTLTFDIGILQ